MGSLVLLNNDFAAMPGIVAEGRRVINNIQRAATLFLVKNIFSLFLSVISLFTDWPYPLQPMHLTVISALTIGIPSFFLAMEPNYDRVTGHFLRGVLRRAFPGGLTNVFAVLVCQAFMVVFDLPAESIAMVCAGILAVVGMMVLFQVCKPFGAFRRIVWGGMLVCLVVVFTCLGELFELRSGTVQTNLLMLTLLLDDAYGIFRHAAPVRLGRKDFPPRLPQGNGVRGLDPSLRYPFRGFSRLTNRNL